MQIHWTLAALHDLDTSLAYIAQEDSTAAQNVAASLKNAAASLAHFPHRGRIGFVEGTREFLVPKLHYFLVYHVQNERIEILRLLHFSQKWPRFVQ